jgi:acyl-coenzyme A thioesterase PaaI-like protein
MERGSTKPHNLGQRIKSALPAPLRATLLLRAFGLRYVPLLLSVRPTVVEISDDKAVLRIPLNRWTRNHLRSMYFGTLAIGADCVAGLLAVHHIRQHEGKEIHFSFKDFHADFLRRPEGNVLFVCEAGKELKKFVTSVAASSERMNCTVPAYAVLEKRPEERVAAFQLTISLRRKA